MRQQIYRLYRGAGELAVQAGATRLIPPSARRMIDRLDAAMRRAHGGEAGAVTVEGMRLRFDPEGYFGAEIKDGQYEPKTTRVVRDLLRPGMGFVDVGAHVGYYALVAAAAVGPGGAVYAFEPDPVSYDYLRQNIDANGFGEVVRPFPCLVAAESGSAQLYFGRRDRVANSMFQVPGVSRDRSLARQVVTLDKCFAALGWPPVHMAKIDVEGAEHAVLLGMEQLAARNPELKLVIEFMPANLKDAGVAPEQIFATLARLGFSRAAMIFDTLEPLVMPRDLPLLLRRCGPAFVNILCEREQHGERN